MPKKREWSREFTPDPRVGKTVNLNVTGVPSMLRVKFRAKCKRVGKSQRNLLLSWIRNWVEGRRPDEAVKPKRKRPKPRALHIPAQPESIRVDPPAAVSLG